MTPLELAAELREFLAALRLSGSVFRSNHASNYLPLRSTLPRDKATILEVLDEVIERRDPRLLKPESLRAL